MCLDDIPDWGVVAHGRRFARLLLQPSGSDRGGQADRPLRLVEDTLLLRADHTAQKKAQMLRDLVKQSADLTDLLLRAGAAAAQSGSWLVAQLLRSIEHAVTASHDWTQYTEDALRGPKLPAGSRPDSQFTRQVLQELHELFT